MRTLFNSSLHDLNWCMLYYPLVDLLTLMDWYSEMQKDSEARIKSRESENADSAIFNDPQIQRLM